MYSQNSWGGPVDPFILVRFDKYQGPADPVVSLVIFEWKDEDFIGVFPDPNALLVCSIASYLPGSRAEPSQLGKGETNELNS